MSNNVFINGLTAVHAGSGGVLTTIDVCKTKIGKHTVPIPYSNVAKSSDSSKTVSSVVINGNPACTKDSVFSKSTGDQPGNKKGIKSHKIKGEASFIMGSSNVFFEGVAATRATDMMVSNKKNTPPMPLVQSGGVSSANSVQAPAEMDASTGPDGIEVAIEGLNEAVTHLIRTVNADNLVDIRTTPMIEE
ncbi:DUF4150 domain-containing protein [Reinekea marinisedimentorum]|uniref:Uncharacterized protein DUF4150 n=1 Tax=Reinekea marinisedimentorum TaxID=230495 RepID=A0A4R3I6I2_9GAMM|nr:DUF4150 domain-containing protein [Reinekea marinisedimentorum]TCS41303.1 uncharacterized protein DUF4150 [Reinekea marinisedimentorum]